MRCLARRLILHGPARAAPGPVVLRIGLAAAGRRLWHGSLLSRMRSMQLPTRPAHGLTH